MKRIFLFSITLLLLYSCQSNIKVEEAYPNGKIFKEYFKDKKTDKISGLYKVYYENGTILEESHYVDGLPNGKRMLFDEDGKQQVIEHYVNGQFEGNYQSFYPNGQVEQDGQYVDGAMEGKWKKFYENGQLEEEVQFTENEENGAFVEWYPNGNLKAEGSYLDGDNEHGELKMYNEQGVLQRKMDCVKGICKTSWKAEDETN